MVPRFLCISDEITHTTSLISKLTLNANGVETVYEYSYDELGNIIHIKKNGIDLVGYDYDELNQLIREDDVLNDYTYCYTYDLSGNMLKRYRYTRTIYPAAVLLTTKLDTANEVITYGYSDSAWGDLLTDYNGTAISYDEIGNPTKWRNTANMEWEGRTLTYHTNLDDTVKTTYTYNSEGIRTQRKIADLTDGLAFILYTYTLDGTKILSQFCRNAILKETYTLNFIYDENGNVTGFNDGTNTYFYQKNIQGDIIRILDVDGNVVVEYTYDAWGKVLSITGTLADTIGQKNPFRYRSYYYDSETGWYYLNSRYYDPEVGRFINADGILGDASTLVGHNMFLYCSNNPVMRTDNGGQFWETVFDVVSLGFSVYDVATNPDDPMAWIGLAGDAIDLIPFVCGVGEAIRAVNVTSDIFKYSDEAVEVVEEVSEEVIDTNRKLEKVKDASSSLEKGTNSVYISRNAAKDIEYVGITNDFARREAEWARAGRVIEPYLDNLSRDSARIIEQTVIETFGMQKNGGKLANKINSISPRKSLYNQVESLLKYIN